MNFFNSESGDNIGYIDYSTSAIGTSIINSSADPTTFVGLGRIFLLTPTTFKKLLPINQPFDWHPSIQIILKKYDEALKELANL